MSNANFLILSCDHGVSVEEITRRVNGGLNGLSDREAYYAKALKIFA